MNLEMGSQTFKNVVVPLLWGSRAVLQDPKGRVSVIDLGAERAFLEILGDKPAPDVEYAPTGDGFEILRGGKALYRYIPSERRLSSLKLKLPDCEIGESEIRVGSNVFSNNMVVGFGVGIAVTEHGIALGSPLPSGLAKLIV